jgi:hypothetical protein
MANCLTEKFTGAAAIDDAATFIEALDDTKFLSCCSYTEGYQPKVLVVYMA